MPRHAKTVTKTVKDPEMIRIFNQMMGQSDPEPEVLMPKYDKVVRICKNILQLLGKFTVSPCARLFTSESDGFNEISTFVSDSKDFLAENELEKITEDVHHLTLEDYARSASAPMYDPTLIYPAYKKLKDSRMVQELLRTCARLVRYKDDLNNVECDGEFIIEQPGAEISFFTFSRLNFKAMFISENISRSGADKYLLMFLRICVNKLVELYDVVTAPDIDVDKFSEMLAKNITKVRGQIPGCNKAFDKIASSIGLLKNNFGGYHKDFLESGNPGIIIENFVHDVARDSSADIKTTAQFGKIISFYRNKMGNIKAQKPEIAKIFSMVDENYRKLEEAQKDD